MPESGPFAKERVYSNSFHTGISHCEFPLRDGWSLWPPLEGEGTGGDRWPLRKFPLLVDSERNIVEGSRIQGQCIC